MDSATEVENIEKLAKEAESLKIRLEDERQKLNDVTRKLLKIFLIITEMIKNKSNFLVAVIAERLEPISCINVKQRRILKGHTAKVLCSDWSPDKRHIVSSSQVQNIFIL